MSTLLTIAIPTYNRARMLDRQLAWLDRSIRGNESACSVIVSDNASPDDSPTICEKWRAVLAARGIDIRINRNPQNVGPLPNIARCIELSESAYTWVVGDDDEIPDETPTFVLQTLRANPSLASLILNFRGTGKTRYARCFQLKADMLAPGRDIVSTLLRQNYFGLAFMTAQVYRTEFALGALRAWADGTKNYDFQIFVTAFTAMQGQALATRDTHVTYVTGENIYETDKRVALRLYADSLEVFVHLARIGYDAGMCRLLARQHLWRLKKRFIKRALTNNPLLTVATVARTLKYLAMLNAIRSPAQQQPGQ